MLREDMDVAFLLLNSGELVFALCPLSFALSCLSHLSLVPCPLSFVLRRVIVLPCFAWTFFALSWTLFLTLSCLALTLTLTFNPNP